MKRSARMVLTLVIPLVLVGVSVAMLLLYSANANARAEALTREVLRAAANEQKDLLSVKLNGEFALLRVFSASIENAEQIFSDETTQQMQRTTLASDFENLVIADESGNAVSNEGQTLFVGDREYFDEALAGGSTIAHIDQSRLLGGGAAFILSTPIFSGEKVVGAIVGLLDEKALRDMLNQNSYEGSQTIVCDSDGRVLVGDENILLSGEGANLFSLLSSASYDQLESGESIVSDIRSGAEGFAEYSTDGERWFVTYVPVGFNDWSICMSIPARMVAASLEAEKSEGYLLIGVSMTSALLLTFIVIALYSRAIHQSRKDRDRLLNAEEEYRISAQQSGVVIIRYDTHNGMLISSQGAIDHFQMPEGRSDAPFCHAFEEIVEDVSREDLLNFRESMLQGDPAGSAEICLRNAEGQPHWYAFEFSAIGDGGGNSSQAIVSIRDITIQHERTAAFKRWQSLMVASVGKYAAMMEINISTGDCERAEGEFLEFVDVDAGEENRRAEIVLGRFEQSKVEKNERERFGAFASLERLRALADQGIQKDEIEIRLLNEEEALRLCLVSAQMAHFPKTDEVKAFITVKDLDDCSLEMEQLSNLALHDGLSGLLNRTAARSAIEEVLRFGSGDRVALFMVDADNFKQINDTLGHQHGDQAIRQMSQAIRSVFRATDVIARIGGDEFFVFLSEFPGEDFAENKAAALCNALRIVYTLEERGSVSLSASIGVVVAERAGTDYETLYSEADGALYEAKNAGKNRYCIRYVNDQARSRTRQPVSAGYALQLQSLMRHLDGGVILLEVGEAIAPLFISEGYFLRRGLLKESVQSGTFPNSVIHPNDFHYVEDAIRKCARDGESFQISYRNVLADGGYGWRHMNAARTPSLGNGLPAIVAVITDITELKNATEHLELLAAQAMVGIITMRIGERFEITFFNDGALAITGFTYEQLRLFSRDASAFFRGGNLEGFRKAVKRATSENAPLEFVYESTGIAGRPAHTIELYGVKLDMQNDVPSYLIIMIDHGDK